MIDKEAATDIKIAAVISIPRIGWNDHWGCVQNALGVFKIPVRRAIGVFWGQCMQNLLESCVADGLDWVITLDYDTMFTKLHLDRMFGHFGEHPEIDALSALQNRRQKDGALLTIPGVDKVTVTGEPIRINTSHFGLTLLRLDALRDVPKPWFKAVPDDKGEWGEGRTDSDIWFWRQWLEAGKTVYVAPDVRVGHLELMVTEFDENCKVRHIHVNEWQKRETKVSNATCNSA